MRLALLHPTNAFGEPHKEAAVKTVLTIAGSDSSGGAGIQADIKTLTLNGVYAASAVTALTAQNTTGISAAFEVPRNFLQQQIDAVFEDLVPNAVKIGMISSVELIETAADRLSAYHAEHIVADPVLAASSGKKLIRDDAIDCLKNRLFPIAELITPNIPEAQLLSGISVRSKKDRIRCAQWLYETYDCAVLCKGGHDKETADDLLYADGAYRWFPGKRIEQPNTHGTGCTLSSAIAANLAKGFDLPSSIERAKDYTTHAIAFGLNLGAGSGPLHHAFDLNSRFAANARQEQNNTTLNETKRKESL